jgi:hypothetical protein
MKEFEARTQSHGEPVSELNEKDSHEYYVLLRRLGVRPKDANRCVGRVAEFCHGLEENPAQEQGLSKRQRKELRAEEERKKSVIRDSIQTIRGVVESFPNLVKPELVQVKSGPEEVVVFRSNR